MAKEPLIWLIRIFLYLVSLTIITFYSLALFISTSFGTEKITKYFLDDSLTYQFAEVEPSLLGVSVRLQNFNYSSAVFFQGEEIELELDLSARTLTAWKQGIQVGTLVPNIPCDTGFVWMCELYNEDDAVRLEAVRLPRPAAVDAT